MDEGKRVKDLKARNPNRLVNLRYTTAYTYRPYIRPRYPRRLSHELPATRSPRTRVYLWWLPTTGGSATVHVDSARSILDDGSPSKAFQRLRNDLSTLILVSIRLFITHSLRKLTRGMGDSLRTKLEVSRRPVSAGRSNEWIEFNDGYIGARRETVPFQDPPQRSLETRGGCPN